MEVVSVPAVVLSVLTVAGKDRLLTFLTRNHGKVRLFARRLARRVPAAYFEAIQGGELTYARAHENAHGRLLAFAPQRVWPGIREDFNRIVHTLAFLEFVSLCATEGEAQPELYDLFVGFLDRIEADDRPESVRLVSTLQLLRIAGFSPHFERCLECGKEDFPGPGAVLSPERGGILCRTCAAGVQDRTLSVSRGARNFMTRVLRLPEPQLRRLSAGAPVAGEVARLLEAFVEARVGLRLRTGAFIEGLRGR